MNRALQARCMQSEAQHDMTSSYRVKKTASGHCWSLMAAIIRHYVADDTFIKGRKLFKILLESCGRTMVQWLYTGTHT